MGLELVVCLFAMRFFVFFCSSWSAVAHTFSGQRQRMPCWGRDRGSHSDEMDRLPATKADAGLGPNQ